MGQLIITLNTCDSDSLDNNKIVQNGFAIYNNVLKLSIGEHTFDVKHLKITL